MELVVVAVLLLSSYSACSVVAQEVLQAPGNQTVFLNQSAVFTCETDGGSTGWSVNGTILDELPPAIEMDLEIIGANTAEGTRLANLTIPARAEYNGIIVSCSVQQRGSFMESANVTLRIQCPLSAVGDLRATSNASSVTISWSALFSLDVTGVDPDIWYSVLIYNVTDENNPTAILCTDCINITETHYTFTPDYLSPCHVYNFSVIPLNGAGQGESSPNITIGRSTFTRTHIKALCDDVAVTYAHNEMVDEYILHGVSDTDQKNTSSSANHGVSTYTLSANKNFSIFFEVFTAGGPLNVSHDTFTTYDVQSLSVEEEEEGGGVSVRGEFMSGSRATGCLVVLQGPPSSPDIFRALLRTQSQDTVSTTVPVPPSTYTVYGYDLEENGLPNTMPAVVLENQIVNTSDIVDSVPSLYLKSANISRRGSTVVIDCEFSEVYPEASCVLVYREYGSHLLAVVDIPQLFDFPVSITVDNPENYTSALFGKNGAIMLDEKPLLYAKSSNSASIFIELPDLKGETDSGKEETLNSQALVVSISIGTVLVCVLVCGSAVLVLVMVRRYYNRSMFTPAADAAGLQTRNVVYDEVVLSPTTTPSSVIPTEPNTAYVTTTIPTDQNVAYAVHSSS